MTQDCVQAQAGGTCTSAFLKAYSQLTIPIALSSMYLPSVYWKDVVLAIVFCYTLDLRCICRATAMLPPLPCVGIALSNSILVYGKIRP